MPRRSSRIPLVVASTLVVVMIVVIAYLVFVGLDQRSIAPRGPETAGRTGPVEATGEDPVPLGGGISGAIAEARDGARSIIAYRNADDEVRFSLYDGEDLVKQSDAFELSKETAISNLRFATLDGRDVALFDARDATWETSYVWETGADRLHYRARRLGESGANFSDGISPGTDIAQHLGFSAPTPTSRPSPPRPAPPVAAPAPRPSGPPVLRVENNGGAKRIVMARDGRVVSRLGQTFDSQTDVWGVTTANVGGRTMAVFSAQDPTYRTRYAWDYDRGRFYWLTQNRSSGSRAWSGNRGNGSNPTGSVRSYLAATL